MFKSEAQQKLAIVRAKHYNDLPVLLRPYYSFRLFIKFKAPFFDSKGEKKDSKHFYGLENTCTYNQCVHGHVENIQLNKLMGFRNCVYMAEEKFKNKYFFAKIYARTSFPDGKFNLLCREYNAKGEIEEQQDPVISDQDNQTLYFTIDKGYMVLTEVPIPTANDFKEEITKALNV